MYTTIGNSAGKEVQFLPSPRGNEMTEKIEYKKHRESVLSFLGDFVRDLKEAKEYLRENYVRMRNDIDRKILEYALIYKIWNK